MMMYFKIWPPHHPGKLPNFYFIYLFFEVGGRGERTPVTNEVSAHACKWFLLPIRMIRFALSPLFAQSSQAIHVII